MLKNAATALGKSSVRQIKTNGPKLKWLYGQERLRWDKKKQTKKKQQKKERKGRKPSEFFIFWKLKFEMNFDRINLGILRPCPA